MASSVDLYGTAYGNFASPALEQVRQETYGEDFGQSSWVTGDEYRRFFHLLELKPTDHVLDIGCGSGGPAVFLANEIGCEVTGVDVNEAGIRAGRDLANKAGIAHKVHFHPADVRQKLPFPDQAFDAIVCMDVICHLPSRGQMFRDWRRVLRPGGRMIYTDPIVVTGLVSKEEFAVRSSTGYFEFAPPGVNERLIRDVSFDLTLTEDVTDNEATISKRWLDARQKRAEELISLEGKDTFDGLQRFLQTVHKLTNERRLSRFVFLARKSNN